VDTRGQHEGRQHSSQHSRAALHLATTHKPQAELPHEALATMCAASAEIARQNGERGPLQYSSTLRSRIGL
jgi:hypothetical protein